MDQIFVIYHPFSMNQEILVHKDGVLKEQVSVSLSRVNDVIYGLANKYDIKNIKLIGNQDYLSQFKAEITTCFKNFEDYKIEVKENL